MGGQGICENTGGEGQQYTSTFREICSCSEGGMLYNSKVNILLFSSTLCVSALTVIADVSTSISVSVSASVSICSSMSSSMGTTGSSTSISVNIGGRISISISISAH